MLFTFIIKCHLITFIISSLRIEFGMGLPGLSERGLENSTRDLLNEKREYENTVDKLDLVNQVSSDRRQFSSIQEKINLLDYVFALNNNISHFETYFGLYFTPNCVEVEQHDSLARRCVEIHRQKWQFITSSNESFAVNRLNLELEKCGINRTTFCKDIAEIYCKLTDNRFLFDIILELNNPDKNQNSIQFVRDLMSKKSLLPFMNTISKCKLVWDKNEEIAAEVSKPNFFKSVSNPIVKFLSRMYNLIF